MSIDDIRKHYTGLARARRVYDAFAEKDMISAWMSAGVSKERLRVVRERQKWRVGGFVAGFALSIVSRRVVRYETVHLAVAAGVIALTDLVADAVIPPSATQLFCAMQVPSPCGIGMLLEYRQAYPDSPYLKLLIPLCDNPTPAKVKDFRAIVAADNPVVSEQRRKELLALAYTPGAAIGWDLVEQVEPGRRKRGFSAPRLPTPSLEDLVHGKAGDDVTDDDLLKATAAFVEQQQQLLWQVSPEAAAKYEERAQAVLHGSDVLSGGSDDGRSSGVASHDDPEFDLSDYFAAPEEDASDASDDNHMGHDDSDGHSGARVGLHDNDANDANDANDDTIDIVDNDNNDAAAGGWVISATFDDDDDDDDGDGGEDDDAGDGRGATNARTTGRSPRRGRTSAEQRQERRRQRDEQLGLPRLR